MLATPLNTGQEVLARAARQGKEIQESDWRGRSKSIHVADDQVSYVEDPEESLKNLSELVREFSQVAGQNQHLKISCIYTVTMSNLKRKFKEFHLQYYQK